MQCRVGASVGAEWTEATQIEDPSPLGKAARISGGLHACAKVSRAAWLVFPIEI